MKILSETKLGNALDVYNEYLIRKDNLKDNELDLSFETYLNLQISMAKLKTDIKRLEKSQQVFGTDYSKEIKEKRDEITKITKTFYK